MKGRLVWAQAGPWKVLFDARGSGSSSLCCCFGSPYKLALKCLLVSVISELRTGGQLSYLFYTENMTLKILTLTHGNHFKMCGEISPKEVCISVLKKGS